MKPFLLILSIALSEALCVHAQFPDYGVYHATGNVKCMPVKGGALQMVHKGSWLFAGDKLVLMDATADVILFTPDSNYLHLRGKGSYSTDDLKGIQRLHVRDNITNRYISLLWDELFRPGSEGRTTGSTGGVSRGRATFRLPVDGYRTSLDRIYFRWEPIAWAKAYQLVFTDTSELPAYESMVSDTQLVVRVKAPLKYGHVYHWSLEATGNGTMHQVSDTGTVVLVDESKVLPKLAAVDLRRLAGVDTALLSGTAETLVRAELYERNGCTHEADKVYHQLLQVRPEAAIKVLYKEFRRRNFGGS